MSIKKTWFSYILWLIATGFSILFTYYAVVNLTRCYGIYKYDEIGFQIGYSVAAIAVVALLCLLLRKLSNSIQLPKMNKWVGRCIHILVFGGSIVFFLYTRYYSFITGELHSNQMVCFYEMARIGFMPEDLETLESVLGNVCLVPSMFENIYMKFLSTVFLFLGNKLELLDMMQLIFQVLSLFSLYLIGWNVQKGLYAWIPALIYAGSPLFASMIGDFGPSNFWLFISLLGMVLIFLLQKIWKSKFITYIVITIWGVCICAFVFGAKFAVLFQNGPAFFVEAGFRVTAPVMYTEFCVWSVVLLLYCITFWFVKTDSVSLYAVPAIFAVLLLLVLQYYEIDVVFFLTIFTGFWLSILGTESLRLMFTAKPKVLTGQNKEHDMNEAIVEKVADSNTSDKKTADRKDFDWTEMKTIMEQKEKINKTEEAVEEDSVQEDTGVIRVSDILKAVKSEKTEVEKAYDAKEETDETESAAIKTTDKTAMIENVLPMPKKHVGRSFDYSFEPSADMMHYDVELENDDYDYE